VSKGQNERLLRQLDTASAASKREIVFFHASLASRGTHALEGFAQLLFGKAGQEARVGDLVAVKMKDRQHTKGLQASPWTNCGRLVEPGSKVTGRRVLEAPPLVAHGKGETAMALFARLRVGGNSIRAAPGRRRGPCGAP
jgi:hypothetical protein